MRNILFLSFVLFSAGVSHCQTDTLEMILDNYFENIGGREAISSIEGYKMSAEVAFSGMTIPFDQYQMKDGRSMTAMSIMGTDMKQGVFDGEVLWSTSQMTMKPEKSDAEETENVKRSIGDFPDPFLKVGEGDYSAEYLGMESADGVECYKVKLTKAPMLMDGEEVENVSFYYFDTENFVPIMTKAEMKEGPAAGQMAITSFSDYQEVEGMYFPFSITIGTEAGGEGQTLTVKGYEINPELEEGFFAFPEEE